MLNAAFQTRVRTREPYQSPLKKGGLGYGSLLMRTQSCQIAKWTSINDVLFDKNVCLCITHFPDKRDWLTSSRELYVSFLFAFSVL